MAKFINAPTVSEDAKSPIQVIRWLKQEGEAISAGDTLLEMEMDKAIVELDAEHEGVLLYIKIPKGPARPGDILGVLGDGGEELSKVLSDAGIAPEMDKAQGVDVIRLPRLSDGMDQARVVKWNIRTGDQVSKGDIIAEVETDKAVIELESFREGTVLYRIPGEAAAVTENQILVILGEPGTPFEGLLGDG